MRVDGVGRYALLGETQDDAAGEAFDKTAQLLGLGYPGGPALSRLARPGQAGTLSAAAADARQRDLDFSFSGLKTAVLTLVKNQQTDPADLARAFVDAIVEVLVAKCVRALETAGLTRLVVAGGVGANRQLRAALDAEAGRRGFDVFYPEPELCTDNGAMIAFAAAQRARQLIRFAFLYCEAALGSDGLAFFAPRRGSVPASSREMLPLCRHTRKADITATSIALCQPSRKAVASGANTAATSAASDE